MKFDSFVLVHWFVWLAGIGCGWLLRVKFENMNRQVGPVPCPHGHEDWDNCPDCCH